MIRKSTSNTSRGLLDTHLKQQPKIERSGLARHGYWEKESFQLHNLWGLHFYQYAGALSLAGQRYPFEHQWLSITPPNQEITWEFPADAYHYYIHFQFEGHKETDESGLYLADGNDRADKLLEDFEFIARTYRTQQLPATVRLWDLLLRLNEPTQDLSLEGSPASPVQIASSFIAENLTQRFSIPELAKNCGVSAGHLNRLFKKAHNISVQEYLQRTRLQEACKLLETTSLPISVIAQSVGIPDLHAFNKFIRQRMKHAPRELRRRSTR